MAVWVVRAIQTNYSELLICFRIELQQTNIINIVNELRGDHGSECGIEREKY